MVVAVVFGLSVLVAWRDARKEQAALQTELQATQKALADATARQASRDSALTTLLAQLKQQKAAVQKPEQVVAALPEVLPLPQAITLGDGAGHRMGTRRKKLRPLRKAAATTARVL